MARTRRAIITVAATAAVLSVAALALVAPIEVGEPPWREEISAAALRGLTTYSGMVSRAQLEQALAIIDPGELLRPYLDIDDTAVALLAAPGSAERLVEIRLAPESVDRTRQARPLAGLRVVVDPGHFGGRWSEVESRHVQLDDGPPIREGTLTWGVGRLLADRLRAAGAEVEVTRGPPPGSGFPSDLNRRFDPSLEARFVLAEHLLDSPANRWFRSYPSILAKLGLELRQRGIVEEGLYPLYSRFDLRRRSAVAASSKAEVTVSLHFNMSGVPADNWLIAFIPGNVMPRELDTVSQRYYALRRAVDGTLPDTIDLGKEVMRSMHARLDVDIVDYVEHPRAPWPKKRVVDADLGVYARNLAILRRTPGPVVLVEGPCLNFSAEYERMQRGGLMIDGIEYPRRIEGYANAVFDALRRWAERPTNSGPVGKKANIR
ncbi:MAG: hypothetical protein V3T05_14425 [Myxococcota bacterium]